MNSPLPSFVTLTGADHTDFIPDLLDISAEYPTQIELGILISQQKSGTARFPNQHTIEVFANSGLRLSAHICGSLADKIFAGHDIDFDLSGFGRVQVNLLERHATTLEIENAIKFGQERDVKVILQCGDNYPDEPRCDWLLDNSFGQGKTLRSVPNMKESSAFCGISGGLSHENILGLLRDAAPNIGSQPFWIDVESALFERGNFSTAKCAIFVTKIFKLNKENTNET